MSKQQSLRNTLTGQFNPTTDAEAAALLQRNYGVRGAPSRLSSEADETFDVTTADGRRLILKLANPAEPAERLAYQNGALLHLESVAPALPVPRIVRTRSGDFGPLVELLNGTFRCIRP